MRGHGRKACAKIPDLLSKMHSPMTLSEVPCWQRTGISGSLEMQIGLSWVFPISGRWNRGLADWVPSRDLFGVICSRCPTGYSLLMGDAPPWWLCDAVMPIPRSFELPKIGLEILFLPACWDNACRWYCLHEWGLRMLLSLWETTGGLGILLSVPENWYAFWIEIDSICRLFGVPEDAPPSLPMTHLW